MELKGYQQKNLDALDRFLTCVEKRGNIAQAYTAFWQSNNPPVTPMSGTAIEPYRDNVKDAPHICHKVPTGGGKTLIAAAALKVAMQHIDPQYKVVVWLVPSNAILEQTLRNLRNRQHPYRQRIDTDFQNRVVVLDKQQALTGHGFSLTTVRENLCILVMSFDSFRTSNKEGRKVYQENGYLQSFAPLVGDLQDGDGEVNLNRVLQAMKPVVVVDESHNATSRLSEQMLNDLHPSLVIDLTATPRENSNVICFTDALELKRNNMVKLPVIVYNLTSKTQVMDSALHLQRRLELMAREQRDGYIRPIVLFQAESKQSGKEERETFEKVKQTLLELRIPEEQIKIKTATIDELKGVDLMAEDCPVRYIITVNALKEGWDCPFAYILASLADRSSEVDVEQIVGRVLRLPYARKNKSETLNLSYVLTASSRFQNTLSNVVKGLNRAGFSAKDYRAEDATEALTDQVLPMMCGASLFDEKPAAEECESIDTTQVSFCAKNTVQDMMEADETLAPAEAAHIADILKHAQEEAEEMEEQLQNTDEDMIPHELTPAVKTGVVQTAYVESACKVRLPEFYVKDNSPQTIHGLWPKEDVKLDGQYLLGTFRLSKQPADINFAAADTNMYKVDIDERTDDHKPTLEKVKGAAYKYILENIRQARDVEDMRRRCTQHVAGVMGKMIPLTDKDIKGYVARIFDAFNEADLNEFMHHLVDHTMVIKKRILALEEEHKEKEFHKMLDADEIYMKPTYEIPHSISLSKPFDDITKMLRSKEESINDFEREVINDVANLDNVEWWTRNIERRGFCINGFINHYPDFIIKTAKGKIVLLETKGDHLDARKKIVLGKLWAGKAGNEYRYCLVYNERTVDGAYTKSQFLDTLGKL